jgi:hypothetical protein
MKAKTKFQVVYTDSVLNHSQIIAQFVHESDAMIFKRAIESGFQPDWTTYTIEPIKPKKKTLNPSV